MIDEAVSILKEYISMENIFFIPFLIFIGNCFKKSERIDDTLIPNILGTLGIFLCSLVSFSQNNPATWINWILLIVISIGQGICVSGVAVFLNQWFKQNQKFKLMGSFDGKPLSDESRPQETLISYSQSVEENHNDTSQNNCFCSSCGQRIGEN